MMLRKTYKYRLYPTGRQVALLTAQLAEACRLYNAALQERREAWRIERKPISFYEQSSQIKGIRNSGDISISNFSLCVNVLRRVDLTFSAFFSRYKNKERKVKAGFPRFKSSRRFHSVTYPMYGNGCRLMDSGKLRLQGIGLIKAKIHRPVEGKIKTATVKRDAGRWYVCFSVECEAKTLPDCRASIGLDVGLSSYVTLSDGTSVENPRYFVKSQAKLRKGLRKLARRKRGSVRRRKAIQDLQRIHAHIRSQRGDFQHKLSRSLVNDFGLIVVENLSVKGLARSRLAKHINDAGWSSFIAKLSYKAEEAGRTLIKIDPRGTSQRCTCGADVPKTLSQRWHDCQACGLSVGRDHASALEILRLGLSHQALTSPITECVA